MTQFTANGNTYSDDGSTGKDMNNGGFRDYLLPMLKDGLTDFTLKQTAAAAAQLAAETARDAAANSAASAANAPGTNATSATSVAIGAGAKSITLAQTGKAYVVGQSVKIASTASPTNWMFGDITAFTPATGAMTVNVTATNGAGTFAAWTVALAGPQGVAGINGYSGYGARSANTMIGQADQGKVYELTGTFTQTFDSAVTLGNAWHCRIANVGTGDITIDPSGTQTIDGMTTFVMYPGEVRMIMSDGANLHSIVIMPFCKTFTASGNFIKPPGYNAFEGLLWGAGASGAKTNGTAGSTAGGGGGGACVPFFKTFAEVGATTTVTIGAGGAAVTTPGANGNAGGNSTWAGVTAYGGKPGVQSTADYASGGNGGGFTYAADIGEQGPHAIYYNGGSSTYTSIPGFGGGVSFKTYSSNYYPAIHSVWGGGAGGMGTQAPVAAAIGGNSHYGGSGGGGVHYSQAAANAGGVSHSGGNGGAGNNATSGGNGVAPAGGGGATNTGAQSGAGANGQMTIWGK